MQINKTNCQNSFRKCLFVRMQPAASQTECGVGVYHLQENPETSVRIQKDGKEKENPHQYSTVTPTGFILQMVNTLLLPLLTNNEGERAGGGGGLSRKRKDNIVLCHTSHITL